ncbi:MAG: hypothetical protein ACOZAL_03065 [Patescibacteria group bacterium]
MRKNGFGLDRILGWVYNIGRIKILRKKEVKKMEKRLNRKMLEDLGYVGYELADKVTLPVKLAQMLASPKWKGGRGELVRLISILVVQGCDLDSTEYGFGPSRYAIFTKISDD